MSTSVSPPSAVTRTGDRPVRRRKNPFKFSFHRSDVVGCEKQTMKSLPTLKNTRNETIPRSGCKYEIPSQDVGLGFPLADWCGHRKNLLSDLDEIDNNENDGDSADIIPRSPSKSTQTSDALVDRLTCSADFPTQQISSMRPADWWKNKETDHLSPTSIVLPSQHKKRRTKISSGVAPNVPSKDVPTATRHNLSLRTSIESTSVEHAANMTAVTNTNLRDASGADSDAGEDARQQSLHESSSGSVEPLILDDVGELACFDAQTATETLKKPSRMTQDLVELPPATVASARLSVPSPKSMKRKNEIPESQAELRCADAKRSKRDGDMDDLRERVRDTIAFSFSQITRLMKVVTERKINSPSSAPVENDADTARRKLETWAKDCQEFSFAEVTRLYEEFRKTNED